MYTAADIRNVEFSKTMGGYKIAEVDAFRDACADTVQTLTAEKEELSKKLGILADKLVEYRRDEDSIRSALLSAQRMGDSVMRDAQQQADAIVAQAKAEAEAIMENAKKDTAEYEVSAKETKAFYEAELVRLKKEVSDFKTNMLSLYKQHLALLKSIPDVRVEVPVQEAPAAPAEAASVPAEEPAQEETVVTEEAPVTVQDAPAANIEAPVEEAPIRRSRFADLKFGEDYNVADDKD